MSVDLKVNNGVVIPVEFWTFPGGERSVRITHVPGIPPLGFTITCNFKGSDDLVDIILLTNAVRYKWPNRLICLDIPYFPFARQDRVMVEGEAHALQAVVQVINMLDFRYVRCLDPHSDTLASLFPPGKLEYKTQWDIWSNILAGYQEGVLVSPDAGAAKKIYKLASSLNWLVAEASKIRNPSSGEITKTVFSTELNLDIYPQLYIVDDICDGGRTFIELAKAIREFGYKGKLVLCVTHGIFSKGLEVLDCFDKILVFNNLSDYSLSEFNNVNLLV